MSFFLFTLVFQTSPYTLSSSDERKRKKAKLSTKTTVLFFVFLYNFLWLLMKNGQRTGEAELTGERKIKPKYKNSDQNNTPDCAIKYREKKKG